MNKKRREEKYTTQQIEKEKEKNKAPRHTYIYRTTTNQSNQSKIASEGLVSSKTSKHEQRGKG